MLSNRNKPQGLLTFIPVALELVLLCFIRVLRCFVLAFKQYQPMLGMAGSSWVGLENFQAFFSSPQFVRVIQNTLMISGLSLALGVCWVFALTAGISSVRNRWIQAFLLGIAALPAAVPAGLWAGTLSEAAALHGQYSRLGAVVYNVLAFSPYGVIAGVLACRDGYDRRRALCAALGYACVGLMLLLSPSPDYMTSAYSPSTYETMDVLDTFTHRRGLLESDYSMGAAIAGAKIFFQLCTGAAGLAGLLLLQRDGRSANPVSGHPRTWLWSLLLLIPALAAGLVFARWSGGADILAEAAAQSALHSSLIIGLGTALVLAVLTCLAARALQGGSRTAAVVLAVAAACSGNVLVWYLQARIMGLVNTNAGVILGLVHHCAALSLLLWLSLDRESSGGMRQFIGKAAPGLLAMSGLVFSMAFGQTVFARALLSQRELLPLGVLLDEVTAQAGAAPYSYLTLMLIPAAVAFSAVFAAAVLSRRSRAGEPPAAG